MEFVYGLIALAVIACSCIIAYIVKKKRKQKSKTPLPKRRKETRIKSIASPHQTVTLSVPVPVYQANSKTVRADLGPRSLKPSQFPCCPYDKLRNTEGSPQVIFWDKAKSCYRCSRGHSFKSNGRIM